MRYRKPEELKETDIKWIGRIPDNWSLKKLKFISEVNSSNVDKKSNEDEMAVELCNYTDVYYNEFITNQLEFMKATASKNSFKRFKLETDDIIITKDSESQDDIAVPALVKETKANLLCGYHLALIKPKKRIVRGDYLFRLFQSMKYREEFGNRSNGITRYGLGVQEIKNIYIHLPPILEQRSIAAFLDRKTEAIDALIEKKEQIIERLKQKPQALITQAVTKGLDPHVPMKDSGNEWLGEIPEHWDVTKIKLVANRVTTGKTPSTSNKDYYSNADIDWFSPGDFNENYLLKDSERKINEYAVDDIGIDLYDPFSVLLVGIGATVGKIGITKSVAFSNQQINAIKFKEGEVNPWFGLYQLDSFKDYIISLASSSTLPIFNQTDTKELFFLKPPKEEQDAIVYEIKAMSYNMFRIIGLIENEINKLKEYRQSLISEAVTGKIDVRSGCAEASADRYKMEVNNI